MAMTERITTQTPTTRRRPESTQSPPNPNPNPNPPRPLSTQPPQTGAPSQSSGELILKA